MLIDQAPKEKEVKKTPQLITNSESASVPIIHGKSDTEPHIMKLNQSDEGQRNPSLNNPHPSRQVDSGGGDHFTKAPILKNDGHKKQAKSPDITHHNNSNRTEKAW
jgi:hypothetical protein